MDAFVTSDAYKALTQYLNENNLNHRIIIQDPNSDIFLTIGDIPCETARNSLPYIISDLPPLPKQLDALMASQTIMTSFALDLLKLYMAGANSIGKGISTH